MSEKSTRRSLLQNAALAAGAAAAIGALPAHKRRPPRVTSRPVWHSFQPAFATKKSKPGGAAINAVIGGSEAAAAAVSWRAAIGDHMAFDRTRSRERFHAGDVRSARLR